MQLKDLEAHYRASACRSTTPVFSERLFSRAQNFTSHFGVRKEYHYRTYYQHDRDKIIYSRSFRNLRLKTQIFPEHTSDLLRTRLDHTLEVSQIARHIANQLKLNEDLADAIAVAHDIGHTPFAHSGERALHNFLKRQDPPADGFKHNWQGVRVADKLERSYPECTGLNLTRAVRMGILYHTGLQHRNLAGECTCDMKEELANEFSYDSRCDFNWEIQTVKLADDIAQVIHDFEDAIYSNSISLSDSIRNNTPLIARVFGELKKKGRGQISAPDGKNDAQRDVLLSRLRSELIFLITKDVIATSRQGLQDWERSVLGKGNKDVQIERFDEHVQNKGDFEEVIILGKMSQEYGDLKEYIRKTVLATERISRMDGKADYIIRNILDVYLKSPRQVHEDVFAGYKRVKQTIPQAHNMREDSDAALAQLRLDPVYVRSCVDHVASMTDRCALREYDQLYAAYPRSEM